MMRMRNTTDSPPGGWIVTPPLTRAPMRDWVFENVLRQVMLTHPDWPLQVAVEQVEVMNAERCIRQGALNFVIRDDRVPGPRPNYGGVIVRRSMANGDAIAATCVADALMEQGHSVIFQTAPAIIPLIKHHPNIKEVVPPNTVCDVDLDGAYERHPNRFTLTYGEIYLTRANEALAARGIRLPLKNWAPELTVPEEAKARARNLLAPHPKPWTMICPASLSHANRTVPSIVWQHAAAQIKGSCFWMGPGQVPGIHPLHFANIVDLLPYLAVADLMVTVDTGPMHMAAALGTPMVAIEQASRPELHISNLRDFVEIRPPLDCLNCLDEICRINASSPPCRNIDPNMIAEAANHKLKGALEDGVSAIICIYQPTVARLNQCLSCVLPQVDEVVISVDHLGFVPEGTIASEKIRIVYNRTGQRFGYGRNANFGARHSCHRWLLLLNDDVFLHEGAVARMREVATDGVGLVAQLLYYPDMTIQHGGTYRNPGDIGFGHLDLGARDHRIKEPVEMENVTLASALVRRSAYYQIKGFDERYLFYCEDNDFCMKIRKAGWRVIYQPKATGIHQEHQSTFTIPDVQRIMRESQALFAQKWQLYFDWNRHRVPGNFDYLKR